MSKSASSSRKWLRGAGGVLAVALIAIALAPSDRKHDKSKPQAQPITPEDVLIDWLIDRGGYVGFEVRHNAAGVRGAYASRAFQPGDTVAAIPTSTCIKLENDGFPAEHAHELAIRIHNNASFIADYLPYFTTLPDPQASLTSELFSDALIEQLQSPRLAEIIKRERAVAEAVYFGKYADDRSPEKKYQPLPEVLKGAEGFTPVAFRWLAAMVSSREFGFHAANGTHTDYLVPVADMCNNDGERYNVQQSNDGTKFYITAVQPIAAGQELLLPYLPGLDHRNDITLAGYGFVLKRDVPILPATDLPTFDPEAPYAPTPATDAEYYGPLGSFNTEEELRRLGGLLEAAGTSEDDDVRLLESENVTDWREGVVLEYRVQRKKAIRLAMAAIRKELVSKMASDDEE